MFLRRKSDEPAAGAPSDLPTDPARDGGKGRATPTRKEAEAARKARVKPVLSAREERKRERERTKTERARQYQAMRSGDERYFQPRDRGPARAYLRDYVDSRRLVAEYFLIALVVILLASFTGIRQVVAAANLLWLTLMIYVIFELVWLNRSVKRTVRDKFPDEPTKGVGLYAVARATQIRRLRMPKPRVKPGDTI